MSWPRLEKRRLDWQPELLGLLEAHRDETGADENAVDVLRRLSQAWLQRAFHEGH